MNKEEKKWNAISRAGKIKSSELLKVSNKKGLMGIYTLGLEHMYEYMLELYDQQARDNRFHAIMEMYTEILLHLDIVKDNLLEN